MPAAFVLLGGKKTETYIRMIKELKLAVMSVGMSFFCLEFICLDLALATMPSDKIDYIFEEIIIWRYRPLLIEYQYNVFINQIKYLDLINFFLIDDWIEMRMKIF